MKMNKVTHLFFFLSVCLTIGYVHAQGTVELKTMKSQTLNREIQYQVYTPEGYRESFSGFQVMYLLHGHGGSDKDWFTPEWGNMGHILDSLIEQQQIPPLVAISLDADNTWYVDGEENMESFYLNEFIPFVESEYHIEKSLDPIIAGDSMGGYGSLRFSLLRPELFSSVILLSPASYEPYPPLISSSRKVAAFSENGKFSEKLWRHFSYTNLWGNLLESKKKPKYYLSVGDDDAFNIVPVVTKLQQDMLRDKIPNELRITNGGHSWDVWRKNIIEALVLIYEDYKP